MKIKKILERVLVDLLVVTLAAITVTTKSTWHGDLAEAEEFANASEIDNVTYPLTRTFTISAYYSPLPCQNRYVTGSYDGDIRLNGGGVRGADGTSVYPGMVAAPRTYDFGTKMDIPGVGIVAVHDRGGAIRASNGVPGVYDRLDIWMGYGDKGLTRALNWGKRTFEVVVYGINDSITEQIILDDYSAEESIANSCVMPVSEPKSEPKPTLIKTASVKKEVAPEKKLQEPEILKIDLKEGSSGEEVKKLQRELKKLNYFRTDVSGYYGTVTSHAVFKFQQSQRLVGDEKSLGASTFGPKTRDRMNEIIASRSYSTLKVAVATEEYNDRILVKQEEQRILATQLEFGMVGPEVSVLQKFLKTQGYFKGGLITDYFGPTTKQALIDFQLANSLIKAVDDYGAGRVGPATLELINSVS